MTVKIILDWLYKNKKFFFPLWTETKQSLPEKAKLFSFNLWAKGDYVISMKLLQLSHEWFLWLVYFIEISKRQYANEIHQEGESIFYFKAEKWSYIYTCMYVCMYLCIPLQRNWRDGNSISLEWDIVVPIHANICHIIIVTNHVDSSWSCA